MDARASQGGDGRQGVRREGRHRRERGGGAKDERPSRGRRRDGAPGDDREDGGVRTRGRRRSSRSCEDSTTSGLGDLQDDFILQAMMGGDGDDASGAAVPHEQRQFPPIRLRYDDAEVENQLATVEEAVEEERSRRRRRGWASGVGRRRRRGSATRARTPARIATWTRTIGFARAKTSARTRATWTSVRGDGARVRFRRDWRARRGRSPHLRTRRAGSVRTRHGRVRQRTRQGTVPNRRGRPRGRRERGRDGRRRTRQGFLRRRRRRARRRTSRPRVTEDDVDDAFGSMIATRRRAGLPLPEHLAKEMTLGDASGSGGASDEVARRFEMEEDGPAAAPDGAEIPTSRRNRGRVGTARPSSARTVTSRTTRA